VEQLFSFVEFRSVTQIMERLWVTVAPFLEPLTAETAGSLNQAGRGIHCSVFPSSIRTRQPRWAEPAESAAKALSSEQQMAATHGRPKQTPERCVFSKFRLPMAIPEPPSAMEACFSERPMPLLAGRLKPARPPRPYTAPRPPPRTMERFPPSLAPPPAARPD